MLIIFIKSFSSLYVNNFSLSTNLRDNISKSSIKCIFLSVYSTPLIGNSLFLLSVFMANTFCKLFVISNVCRFSSLGGNVYRFSSLGGRWGLAFLLIYEQLITYIVFHFITDIYDVNKYTSNLIHDICILDRLFADTYNCHSPYTVQTEFVSVMYPQSISTWKAKPSFRPNYPTRTSQYRHLTVTTHLSSLFQRWVEQEKHKQLRPFQGWFLFLHANIGCTNPFIYINLSVKILLRFWTNKGCA